MAAYIRLLLYLLITTSYREGKVVAAEEEVDVPEFRIAVHDDQINLDRPFHTVDLSKKIVS